MDQNLQLNTVDFLKNTLKDMRSDINYAYPSRLFDESRGHAALQMVGSKIETLMNFLDALEQKPQSNDQ